MTSNGERLSVWKHVLVHEEREEAVVSKVKKVIKARQVEPARGCKRYCGVDADVIVKVGVRVSECKFGRGAARLCLSLAKQWAPIQRHLLDESYLVRLSRYLFIILKKKCETSK